MIRRSCGNRQSVSAMTALITTGPPEPRRREQSMSNAAGRSSCNSRRHPQTTEVVQGRRLSVDDFDMETLLEDAPDSLPGCAEYDDEEVGENPDKKDVENCCGQCEKQEIPH